MRGWGASARASARAQAAQLDHPLAWNAGTNTRVREGGGREGEEGGRRAELLVAETLPARVIEHQRTAHSGRRGPVPCREAYVPLLGLPASPASVRRPRRSAPACAAAPATAPATAPTTARATTRATAPATVLAFALTSAEVSLPVTKAPAHSGHLASRALCAIPCNLRRNPCLLSAAATVSHHQRRTVRCHHSHPR